MAKFKKVFLVFLLMCFNFTFGDDKTKPDEVYSGSLEEILIKFHAKPYLFLNENGGKIFRFLGTAKSYDTTSIFDLGIFQLKNIDEEMPEAIDFSYVLGSCYSQDISKVNRADKYIGILYSLILYKDMKLKKKYKNNVMEELIKNQDEGTLLECLAKYEENFKAKLHEKLRESIGRFDVQFVQNYLENNSVDLEWAAKEHSNITYSVSIIDLTKAYYRSTTISDEDKQKIKRILQILDDYNKKQKNNIK